VRVKAYQLFEDDLMFWLGSLVYLVKHSSSRLFHEAGGAELGETVEVLAVFEATRACWKASYITRVA
jgi:hypothetical protein